MKPHPFLRREAGLPREQPGHKASDSFQKIVRYPRKQINLLSPEAGVQETNQARIIEQNAMLSWPQEQNNSQELVWKL